MTPAVARPRLEAEIAIVGGGLIGCMTAYYLRRRGRSVVVVERGMVGGASSGVSFGSLRLQGQHAAELPLAVRAHAIWERIEAELGVSVEFVQRGHVHLALHPDHVQRLEANAAEARAFGLDIELLGRGEMLRRWPFLGSKALAASWSWRDAVVNPRYVAPVFARAAAVRGTVVRQGTEVVAAEHVSGRFLLHTRGPGDAPGSVASDILVNAAGAWCGALAAQFGETIPVFAAGPAELVTEPVPRFVGPVIHAVDGSVLFRQTDRGNLIVGGHPRMKIDAASRRARVEPEKLLTNMSRLAELVPGLRRCRVVRSWTGIEGYVTDMMPVLGPSRTTPGLFHACAFSGHGLQLGPGAATVLADLIVGGKTDLPIGPFGIERFVNPASPPSRALVEEFQPSLLRALERPSATS